MTPPISRNSILSREIVRPEGGLTSLQSQVDGLVGGFVQQATDWRSLAAMTAGGMTYRLGRMGAMAAGTGRLASVGIGLGAEVTAFEMTNRSLSSLTGENHLNHNLWRWEGQGGIRQGLLSSLVTFGSLKGAGRLAQGENVIVQHLLQDTGMVLGHQVSGAFGITQRPMGSLAEQFLHAEVTNLQLGAGMAFAHSVAPGIQGLERGLDLSLQLVDARSGQASLQMGLQPALATARGGGIIEAVHESSRQEVSQPTNLHMSSINGEKGGGKPPAPFLPPPMTVHSFRGTDAFYEAVDQTLENLPAGTTCLVIELNVKSLNNMGGLAERLLHHPTLQEIRIRYANGKLKWFIKDGGEVMGEEEDGHAGWWFEDHSERSVRLGLQTPWTPPEKVRPFHEWVRQLRIGSDLPSLRAAVRRAKEQWSFSLNRLSLGLYESDPHQTPSFEGLWILSRLYGVDLNDLIESSNRTRFPELDPKSWRTLYYPILIEREADLRRIEFFSKTDPLQRSFGWLLFSARKNPFAYFSGNELSKKTLVSPEHLWDLELNRGETSGPILTALSNALRLPEPVLIPALNDTFHRSLRAPLRLLFPGRQIYIDPQSEDEKKVRSYLQSPGSIGQVLFAHRKSLPEFLSTVDMERRVKIPVNWDGRERNLVPVTENNWIEWVGFFVKVGIPLVKLHPFLKKIGVSPESPRYHLAKAMAGMTLDEFSKHSGVAEVSLRPLLKGTSVVSEPGTLLSLKRTLPNLTPSFFRAHLPDLTAFFPEASGETPAIRITSGQAAQLTGLRLGERLYAHRMEQGIGKVDMGRTLGVSALGVDKYERTVCDIDDTETLLNLSRVLSLDPKVLYLYYHPEILKLFPVLEADSGNPLSVKPAASIRNVGPLRSELRRAMEERSLKTQEDLRSFLDLPETPEGLSKTRKFFELLEPLNAKEILHLTRNFGLSIRSWYEHYYGSTLAYFLGKREDGSINYEFPSQAPSRQALESFDLLGEVTEALTRRFPSYTKASRALRAPYLASPTTIRRGIDQKSWKEETLARVSRDLGIDRRLLFFYFRGEELRQVLEGDRIEESPSPPILRVPRMIRSSEGTEYPFELILPDLQTILAAPEDAEFPMAQRGPEPILIRVVKREEVETSNSFFDFGTPVLRFHLKEGETRGIGVVMMERDALNAFALDTHLAWGAAPAMAPGAGTIAMEWLATQAALHEKEINFLNIENYQILSILMRQDLLDPETAVVEAGRWEDKELSFYDVTESFPLSDTQALRRNMAPDFWNVRGRPHPRLLHR